MQDFGETIPRPRTVDNPTVYMKASYNEEPHLLSTEGSGGRGWGRGGWVMKGWGWGGVGWGMSCRGGVGWVGHEGVGWGGVGCVI